MLCILKWANCLVFPAIIICAALFSNVKSDMSPTVALGDTLQLPPKQPVEWMPILLSAQSHTHAAHEQGTGTEAHSCPLIGWNTLLWFLGRLTTACECFLETKRIVGGPFTVLS